MHDKKLQAQIYFPLAQANPSRLLASSNRQSSVIDVWEKRSDIGTLLSVQTVR